MRLRRLDIEVFTYFVSIGVPKEVFAPLRNQADVLSWYLWRFLKSKRIEAPISQARIIAQTHETCTVTDEFFFIKVNPKPPFDVEKGPLEQVNLDAMASLVIRASQSSFATDWSWINEALSDFQVADHEARYVRVARRPRGTETELRLEERVSNSGASIDFVARFRGEETRRETVSQVGLLPNTWSGCLNKIVLDGNRVRIDGRIPTAVPSALLGSAPHGAARTRLEWYEWSRTFSELGLPNYEPY